MKLRYYISNKCYNMDKWSKYFANIILLIYLACKERYKVRSYKEGNILQMECLCWLNLRLHWLVDIFFLVIWSEIMIFKNSYRRTRIFKINGYYSYLIKTLIVCVTCYMLTIVFINSLFLSYQFYWYLIFVLSFEVHN